MSRILSIIGIFVTFIYGIFLFLLTDGRLNSLNSMPLNEVGDFLAGAFGPLAIFWLILGFIQQGKELGQNTKALELQAKELRNSVEQQKEMVFVANKKFEADIKIIEYEREKEIKAAKPSIVFMGFGGSHSDMDRFTCNLINSGASISNVKITFNTEVFELSGDQVAVWPNGEKIRVKFSLKKNETPKIFLMHFKYNNRNGISGEEGYVINSSINNQGLPELRVEL